MQGPQGLTILSAYTRESIFIDLPTWRDTWSIEAVDVADPESGMAHLIGTLIPPILLITMVMAGIYPATEVVAGERERKTLETSLTAAVPRSAILIGKLAAVVTLMMLAASTNLGAMVLTATHQFALMSGEGPTGTGIGLLQVLATLPHLLSAAMAISSLMILVVLPTHTFKQAQNLASIAGMFFMLPALSQMDPLAHMTLATALLPMGNTAVAVRGLLDGSPAILSLHALSVGVNLAVAGLALGLAAHLLRGEALVSGIRLWRSRP